MIQNTNQRYQMLATQIRWIANNGGNLGPQPIAQVVE